MKGTSRMMAQGIFYNCSWEANTEPEAQTRAEKEQHPRGNEWQRRNWETSLCIWYQHFWQRVFLERRINDENINKKASNKQENYVQKGQKLFTHKINLAIEFYLTNCEYYLHEHNNVSTDYRSSKNNNCILAGIQWIIY